LLLDLESNRKKIEFVVSGSYRRFYRISSTCVIMIGVASHIRRTAIV